MAESSSWVPYVELFVDASRRTDEHSAALAAIKKLVQMDHLSLIQLVKGLETYMTSADHIIRSRGILLFAEVCTQISSKPLDCGIVNILAEFFISKMSDIHVVHGSLMGSLALVRRSKGVGTVLPNHVTRLTQSFLRNVPVQSLSADDRKLCFELFNCILNDYPESVTTMGIDLLTGISEAINHEKDPRCLMLAFRLVETAMKQFSELSNSLARDYFDLLSGYYPIYFTNGGGSDFDITRADLSMALLGAFCSSPSFEPFVVPMLLEKLSSSLQLAKIDSLKYLSKCIDCYGPDRMLKHVAAIWSTLKIVIFHSEAAQYADDVRRCLRATVSCLTSADDDLLLNLILEDEEVLRTLDSVTGERSSSILTSNYQSTLCVIGCIFSVLSEASVYSCSKLFGKYFQHLVDLLKASRDRALIDTNYGALYLCVEMLASCKELMMESHNSSEDAMTCDTWLPMVEASVKSLIHDFSTLLCLDGKEGCVDQRERVLCGAKGLYVLATFPNCVSHISEDEYVKILQILMLLLMCKFDEALLWKSSLDSLAQIGSSVTVNPSSWKQKIYDKLVIEPIFSSLLPSNDCMPLVRRLEAVSKIGSTGPLASHKTVRAFEEAIITLMDERTESTEAMVLLLDCYCKWVIPLSEDATPFALQIWNQLEKSVVSRMKLECFLDSLMITMKLLVGLCTEESQRLILQKAYDTLLSVSSISDEILWQPFCNLHNPHLSMDVHMLSLLSGVIIALRPQTQVSNLCTLLDLFGRFSLMGHLPSAQALGSIFNKWWLENISDDFSLMKAIDMILQRCSSCISSGSSVSQSGAVVTLAWIGKALIMRGHEKAKDVTASLLNLICPDLSSHQRCEDDDMSDDCTSSLQESAVDAFLVIMADTEACLNRRFYAVEKPLYKQRYLNSLLPVIHGALKSTRLLRNRLLLYHIFGHIITNSPISSILLEAHKVTPTLVDCLLALHSDVRNKDLLHSILLVLSGIITDANGQHCITENITAMVGILTQLVSYPYAMLVRKTAIQCLVAVSSLPHAKVYPMRRQVLKSLVGALDDSKRAVRLEAVKCRHAWASMASRTLRF